MVLHTVLTKLPNIPTYLGIPCRRTYVYMMRGNHPLRALRKARGGSGWELCNNGDMRRSPITRSGKVRVYKEKLHILENKTEFSPRYHQLIPINEKAFMLHLRHLSTADQPREIIWQVSHCSVLPRNIRSAESDQARPAHTLPLHYRERVWPCACAVWIHCSKVGIRRSLITIKLGAIGEERKGKLGANSRPSIHSCPGRNSFPTSELDVTDVHKLSAAQSPSTPLHTPKILLSLLSSIIHNGICTLCPPYRPSRELFAFAQSFHPPHRRVGEAGKLGWGTNADRDLVTTGQSSPRTVRCELRATPRILMISAIATSKFSMLMSIPR